jgi:hypothetical protein
MGIVALVHLALLDDAGTPVMGIAHSNTSFRWTMSIVEPGRYAIS